jgi:CheY-like chemotaxis protein
MCATFRTLSGRLDGISVLLVDDDGDSRRLIAKALTDLGATVATAASSSQALEMLSNSIPEVIISDIGMPGESGYDFIRKVRLLPPEKGGKIPAIALTAYNRMDDRVTALRAGFQSHIAKPAEIAEIVATVQAFTAGEQF